MSNFTIRVGHAEFEPGAEIAALSGNPAAGAIASFVGLVRNYGDAAHVTALELEHYPGMTEAELARIVDEARQRWPLTAATIIHRVGYLPLGEQIVLVVVAAGHRRDAFAACEFLMDYLKTRAPFWKKEHYQDGSSRWVDAKDSDDDAAARWMAQ
ncbi:molybdopterin synthase catalytic subunit MoaE [Neisseriaceae bacterium JH1-16]|nr:molybdopterin synthase catalytic subunit MoaE [Neisseriaceae bacterium JH1-16]